MRPAFLELPYESADELVFGSAKRPVRLANGITIGGGRVFPEVNFTLPPIDINQDTMPGILAEYREMVSGILTRACELSVPALVLEVELLPPMTNTPRWGIDVIKAVKDVMVEFETKRGLKVGLRATPNDTREFQRPTRMRDGQYLDAMLETFAGVAEAGADLLSIESTGGKELHDDALVRGDLRCVIFALSVMGARDMEFLWNHIASIAKSTGAIAAGDTACGFGNTAMVLADKGYIPRLFSAIVRVATVARSLAAYEAGAVGPSKDCAYEGPYIKAITGYPIAMEGRTSACAHLSPLGNIAGAVCDLWSNESVQNIKLLGAMAPTVSLEQLTYDCRLYDQATIAGETGIRQLRDWLTSSDASLDPQAYVLKPNFVYEVSKSLIKGKSAYERTKLAVARALELLKQAVDDEDLLLAEREKPWFDIMQSEIDSLPESEDELWAEVRSTTDTSTFTPADYGLS
jgi:methanol--5-hydroxybenzimidazolylcobamide Co-methyltransferase